MKCLGIIKLLKVLRKSTTDKGFVYIKYHHYINLWTIFYSLHEFLILRKMGEQKSEEEGGEF